MEKLVRIRVRRDTITLSATMFGEALCDHRVATAIVNRAIEHARTTGRVVKITVAKPLTISSVEPKSKSKPKPRLRLVKGGR